MDNKWFHGAGGEFTSLVAVWTAADGTPRSVGSEGLNRKWSRITGYQGPCVRMGIREGLSHGLRACL